LQHIKLKEEEEEHTELTEESILSCHLQLTLR